MGQDHLRLKAAFATRDHTVALKSGQVVPERVSLDIAQVESMVLAFRKMIRSLEFDICELPPITYMAALDAGIPLVALPIFVNREFHHGDLVCRPGSNIYRPQDLEGKRVGVRAYTVTTGVWARGLLATQYRVALDRITWVVDDEDHVDTIDLPHNVERLGPDDSIVEQFRRGEIDAALTGAAGIGRTGSPRAGWKVEGQSKSDARQQSKSFYPLFPDSRVLEADWYRRTGIYPIHGLIAIKKDIVADHPWIASSLMTAFEQAKAPFIAALSEGARDSKDLERFGGLSEIVDADPLPYGVDQNRASIEAMIEFAFDQGIIRRRFAVDELFIEKSPTPV